MKTAISSRPRQARTAKPMSREKTGWKNMSLPRRAFRRWACSCRAGLGVLTDDVIIGNIQSAMEEGNVSDWAVGLICDGLLSGISSILSFLPQILLLFLFLSILEDSGYMARVRV